MTVPNSIGASNTSQSDDPFIWGHIAILAGIPWLLTLSMAGLAVGDPVFATWFEIFVLGFPAIALTTWVQWQQPFLPFSLWLVAKPIESLTDRDRRVLSLIKQQRNGWYVTGWIAIAVAILMGGIFCKIYDAAPLAQAIAPFPNWLRFLGIVWAEFFFLLSNVLLQSGISALRIKLTTESELLSLQPFAIEKIKNSFTNIGWRSSELLKFFEDEIASDNAVVSVSASTTSAPKIEETAATDGVDIEELKIFNVYVENILQEYLEQEVEPIEQEVESVVVENILQENLEEEVESVVVENILQQNLEEEVEQEVESVVVENILQEYLEQEVEPIEQEIEPVVVENILQENLEEQVEQEVESVENILQEYLEQEVEPIEQKIEPVVVENILQENLEEQVEQEVESVVVENILQENLEQEVESVEEVESENTLQEHLEEPVEEVDNKETDNKKVADIAKVAVISEMTIVEEILVTETILSETIVDNLLSIETQSIVEIFEEVSIVEPKDVKVKAPKHRDPKYLVEEFLVDKYLAKLEELNNVEKTNKLPIQTTESPESSSTDSVVDEFADLDELINGKPFSE